MSATLVIILATCAGLFAIYQLYQNSKTDGFDSGWIEISQCTEKDFNWKIYNCTGNYTSGVGMMGKDNVSVTVTAHKPEKGDVIYDVYPSMFRSKMDSTHFVTGKERSSVIYNIPWLSMLFVSMLTFIGVILYTHGYIRTRNE